MAGSLELVPFCPSLTIPGSLLSIVLGMPDAAVSAPLASGNSNDENRRFFFPFSSRILLYRNRYEGLQPALKLREVTSQTARLSVLATYQAIGSLLIR
jgi:hypothetical protein